MKVVIELSWIVVYRIGDQIIIDNCQVPKTKVGMLKASLAVVQDS